MQMLTFQFNKSHVEAVIVKNSQKKDMVRVIIHFLDHLIE